MVGKYVARLESEMPIDTVLPSMYLPLGCLTSDLWTIGFFSHTPASRFLKHRSSDCICNKKMCFSTGSMACLCHQVTTYVKITLEEFEPYTKYLLPKNPFPTFPIEAHKAHIWAVVEYFARAKHIHIPRGWEPGQLS